MKRPDRYTYRVSWSEEDREYIATCAEFPSLSWLDESPEKALTGVRKLVSQCLIDMKKTGEPIPEGDVDGFGGGDRTSNMIGP